MSKKPWTMEEGGLILQGFLGAYGLETGQFETSFEIIQEAARVYEMPPLETVAEMAAAVSAIPKKQRRVLAYKNIEQGKRARVGVSASVDLLSPAPASDGPDHKALLHQVVMAVINAGQGDILKGIDDLNAYYNTRIPTVADIVGGRPETAIITGGLEWDDKVYSFSVARTVRREKCPS